MNEYTRERWGDKIYCADQGYTFPGWYYLQRNDGGDYSDDTTIYSPSRIKESMRKTLDAFTYMSVIENA